MKKTKSIFKEILQTKFQIIIFILCLILSIGTFISIDSLRYNVEDFIERDSKILNGGDIIIDSNKVYSNNLTNAIEYVSENFDNISIVRSYSFSSVVYSEEQDASILSQIRIVSELYPLYGEAELKSGKKFDEVFTSGNIVVHEDLLTRLEKEIGDSLKIGDKEFVIADVITVEPDQPLSLFNIGPRILVPEVNLEEVNLVGNKSRVFYETFIKTQDDDQTFEIIEYINSKTIEDENANYYFDEENSLKRFVLNFLFFIKLISIFIIIITGIGMTSIIFSYLDDKKISIGIRKSLGERNNSIVKYYYSTIFIVSVFATVFAVIFSYFLMNLFPSVFTNILPEDIEITLSTVAVLKGIFVSLIISSLFTFYPLATLRRILPIQIFRREESNLLERDRTFYIVNILILIFFVLVIFLELQDFKISLYLVLGSLVLFAIMYVIIYLILKLTRKIKNKVKSLELRHSLNGLFRIGNKTTLVITSITLSLTILFTISFIELNLQNQFVESFPEDAPNLFVLDVPKNNISDLEKIIGNNVSFYPVIRGSLVSVNGVDSETIEEGNSRFSDSLTRTFSLTYGTLLESEEIIDTNNPGKLFEDDWNKEIVQVSVLDEILEIMNGKIGDKLIFLIQGVEIEAEIVSTRTRVNEGITAFFYFTFEEEVLIDAPQTVFTFVKIEPEKIPELQNEIVKNFPTVTVINGESTAKTVGEIITQLSSVISFFTFFSLAAGVLILLSSIVSTNSQRTQEAVFYKLVGSPKRFIKRVFIFEYFYIGIVSSLISVLLSTIVTYSITRFFLDIDYVFFLNEIIIYSIITIIIITLIGYLSSLNVIRKKPIEYIREKNVE